MKGDDDCPAIEVVSTCSALEMMKPADPRLSLLAHSTGVPVSSLGNGLNEWPAPLLCGATLFRNEAWCVGGK